MTVQEMIDELNLIEDKTKPVKTYSEDMGKWGEADPQDYGDFVGIR